MRAVNVAKRMRDSGMVLEIGDEEVSNALTQNIDHSLIGLLYES